MKQLLKSALSRYPHLFSVVQTYRDRRTQKRYLSSNGLDVLNRRVFEATGGVVATGPFKGMRYPEAAVADHNSAPLLLGVYEHYLHDVIAQLPGRGYDHIVDLGSAEGYYAVGLTLTTGLRVTTFDVSSRERRLCAETARLNGVADRVEIRSWCEPPDLIALASGSRAFVLCDIDGGEFHLLTPDVIAALERSDVLLELHGSSEAQDRELAGRFSTHRVEWLTNDKVYPNMAAVSALLGKSAELACCEHRPLQRWVWCHTS